MHQKTSKIIFAVILTVFLIIGFTSQSIAKPCCQKAEEASASAIVADFLLARPFWLTCTVLGTGLFVLTSPFTLWGDNMDHAAQVFVVQPAKYTFSYPLGAH